MDLCWVCCSVDQLGKHGVHPNHGEMTGLVIGMDWERQTGIRGTEKTMEDCRKQTETERNEETICAIIEDQRFATR
jgi:hypothetical protein